MGALYTPYSKELVTDKLNARRVQFLTEGLQQVQRFVGAKGKL